MFRQKMTYPALRDMASALPAWWCQLSMSPSDTLH